MANSMTLDFKVGELVILDSDVPNNNATHCRGLVARVTSVMDDMLFVELVNKEEADRLPHSEYYKGDFGIFKSEAWRRIPPRPAGCIYGRKVTY